MKRLKSIVWELERIREEESTRLFRMARRAAAHGCSCDLVHEIRCEAWKIRRMNVEDLLDPFIHFNFAFREDFL